MTERQSNTNVTYLIPMQSYLKQLEQIASQYEWDGDLEKCDKTLEELRVAREYHLSTGSLFFPLF